MRYILFLSVGALTMLGMPDAGGAEAEPNYDEGKVPEYTLPEPLTLSDGAPVRTPADWWGKRRPELLRLFTAHVYGSLPDEPVALRLETLEADREALDGRATRKQVTVHLTGHTEGPRIDLLLYLPNGVAGPAPVFAGLNFAGNHTVWPDPAIRLPHSWVHEWGDAPTDDGRPLEEARGARQRRWPVDRIIDRGYGLLTAHYGDLFPDRKDGFEDSVYPSLDGAGRLDPGGGDWSAISAWAWGLSRMMDYCEHDPDIDDSRVIVVGHSRLGKTALWAGANDPRFAAVVDNASGAGGSALFRRRYGERLVHLVDRFPHWFCRTFRTYTEDEAALPVDQHELLALSAPRPLLINAMTEDRWADPRGMFLAGRAASPVWILLGEEGLAAGEMPEPGEPVLSRVGFHLREGRHDVLPQDWEVFLDFAETHLAE